MPAVVPLAAFSATEKDWLLITGDLFELVSLVLIRITEENGGRVKLPDMSLLSNDFQVPDSTTVFDSKVEYSNRNSFADTGEREEFAS